VETPLFPVEGEVIRHKIFRLRQHEGHLQLVGEWEYTSNITTSCTKERGVMFRASSGAKGT